MDPKERDELLRKVDDELDETPKGRAMKSMIKTAYARSQKPDAGSKRDRDGEGSR